MKNQPRKDLFFFSFKTSHNITAAVTESFDSVKHCRHICLPQAEHVLTHSTTRGTERLDIL